VKRVTHKALFFVLLLLVLVAFLWISLGSRPVVHGELTRSDVSAIVRVVKSDMWREAFPDFSWATVKRAPLALVWVLTARVSEVTQPFENRARARGSFGLQTRGEGWLGLGWDRWTLKKEGGIWNLQGRSRSPATDVVNRPRKPIEEPTNFLEVMSNNARISFDVKP
jgi:hypothetical protein